MNSVILIGRLTRDPELTYTPNNQTAVTHFSIAVDRPGSQGRERFHQNHCFRQAG